MNATARLIHACRTALDSLNAGDATHDRNGRRVDQKMLRNLLAYEQVDRSLKWIDSPNRNVPDLTAIIKRNVETQQRHADQQNRIGTAAMPRKDGRP